MSGDRREGTDPFYSSAAWQRLREQVVLRDRGMCVECLRLYELGLIRKPRRAQMVHHVIPLKDAPELALTESNLVSLCYKHHEEKHPERRAREDTPRPPMRVIKV
ncbi:MAG: HNH endonuclease [Clostridiales bacterium]|nr:HNH endonuclease [Clostridiales bacterium]